MDDKTLLRDREKKDAYISQHRACSLDDPKWLRIDAQRVKAAEREKARRADFQIFIDKYGMPDDLIEEYYK